MKVYFKNQKYSKRKKKIYPDTYIKTFIFKCVLILYSVIWFNALIDGTEWMYTKVCTWILLEREPGGVNLAGKVKNLFLVTIDAYRLENKKLEVCRVSGGGGTMGSPGASSFINSS